MAEPDEVELHVSIDIHVDETVGTGRTVAQWNALDDAERQRIAGDVWESLSQHDGGGMSVVTPGAEEI